MARRHPILRTLVLFAALGFFLIVGLASYTYLASEGFATFSKNAVAVVTVQGVIEDASDIVRSLDGLTDNEGVRAVVLRVDSPGGGVAPSQEIYGAIERVREHKPVVDSLGSVAASGGYYIASACDSIVANPGTLTGSIGVIMKAGKFKDIGSPLREMTDEERRFLEGLLANVHEQFIVAVAKGRKLPEDQVRPLADGRIYSGQQALDLHLVDALGGLRDAVELAATRAGIHGEPRWLEIEKHQPPWWWRRITG